MVLKEKARIVLRPLIFSRPFASLAGVSYVCPNVCQIVLFLETSVIANCAIVQPLIKFSGIIQCHTLAELNLIIIIYYNGGYDLMISRRTYAAVSFCGELQLEKVARERLTKLDGLHISKARRLWSLHVGWADEAETEYVNFSGDVWC